MAVSLVRPSLHRLPRYPLVATLVLWMALSWPKRSRRRVATKGRFSYTATHTVANLRVVRQPRQPRSRAPSHRQFPSLAPLLHQCQSRPQLQHQSAKAAVLQNGALALVRQLVVAPDWSVTSRARIMLSASKHRL
jgi:hypothetical protein